MPGFTLNVTFEGLCGFVPFKNNQGEIKSMWVLMPDRRAGTQSPYQPPVHTPVVRCDIGDLQHVDLEYLKCHWYLDNYDLRILPGGQPVAQDSLQFRSYDPRYDENTGTDHDHSFAWLAPTEAACRGVEHAGGGIVRPDLVQANSPNAGTALAARLFVNFGEVRVSSLGASSAAEGSPLQYVLWRFRSFAGSVDPRNLITRVASQVMLEMKIDTDYVELRAAKFDGTAAPSLSLAPADPTKPVNISILNEESDAIVGAKEYPAPLEMGVPRVRDRVYEAFFDLAQDVGMPSDERPIPVPSMLEPLNGGVVTIPTVVSPPCSPGRFPVAG